MVDQDIMEEMPALHETKEMQITSNSSLLWICDGFQFIYVFQEMEHLKQVRL